MMILLHQRNINVLKYTLQVYLLRNWEKNSHYREQRRQFI
jgi:hypothetical protein